MTGLAPTPPVRSSPSPPLRAVTYQSVKQLNRGTLEHSVSRFRQRNRERGITGMLVEHGPRFVQFMEGEPDAVERLWRAIQRDPRHTDLDLVADVPADTRLFAEHPLGFTTQLPAIPLDGLLAAPETAMASWSHIADGMRETDSIRALLTEAIRGSPDEMWGLAQRLRDGGVSVESIYLDVIEPAVRSLGDRWRADRLPQIDVSVAMSALQLLVRQLGPAFRIGGTAALPPRSALVALQPGEPHLVDLGLVSEFFDRAGWDVQCAYPDTDEALVAEVRERRYDALTLCTSGAFERPERREAFGRLIRQARQASLNPDIAVLASGRDFHAHPSLGASLGADAALGSAAEAVGVAEAILRSRQPAPRPLGALAELVRQVLARL